MAFPRLGRLPPLHSIGRAQSVDLEEPPDIGDESEVDNLIQEYENYERGYYFMPEHAYSAAESFEKLFRISQPGNHVCKRNSEGASPFSHCQRGLAFGHKYKELRRHLELKAKLEFMREYTLRINQMVMFVQNLQTLVKEEYQTWRAICKNQLQSPPTTHMDSLSEICDNLRLHMSHWNSLKQLVLMDKWLRPHLPVVAGELVLIRDKLFYLRNCAIWWTDRLLTLGFRVLSHCDPSHLSQEVLWGVTRGLEEFNSIVTTVQMQSNTPSDLFTNVKRSLTIQYNYHTPANVRTFLSAPLYNSVKVLVKGIKPKPFQEVLKVLAHERSKYVAFMTHEFFTASEEFLYGLLNSPLQEYIWSDHLSGKSGKYRPASGLESSDYYTQTGSNVSMASSISKVNSIQVPDLSQQDADVAEFASKEQEFAIKFLHIVNRSTKLLKRPHGSARSNIKDSNCPSVPVKRVGLGSLSMDNFSAFNTLRGSRSGTPTSLQMQGFQQDEDNISLCSMSSTLSSKKSVSWGDTGEHSIMKHLSERYLDMLWEHYDGELWLYLNNPVTEGQICSKTKMGNVVLTKDMVAMMLVTMVQQTCKKDIFPPGSVVPLINMSRRLQAETAWAAWDQAYCSALASHVSDKCQATPLVDGEYSTKTGRLLRDAFQPLLNLIQALDLNSSTSEKKQRAVCLALVSPTLHRVILTAELAYKWCALKCDQFLTQCSTGSFLLVTQSDLKILSDEVCRTLCSCQDICRTSKKATSLSELHLTSQLLSLYQKLNDVSSQLQTLSGSSVKRFSESCHAQAKEFFEENMPVSKYWKKKSSHEAPVQHSEYISHAVDSILEPVVCGMEKLRRTSQISAVSVAVTAMCEAWTQHILSHKLKFSYLGACQLELDFMYTRDWLSNNLQSDEQVHQSVLSLDIFKYLQQAAFLLKQQPPTVSSSRPTSNYSRSTALSSKSDTGCSTLDSHDNHSSEAKDDKTKKSASSRKNGFHSNVVGDSNVSDRVEMSSISKGFRSPSAVSASSRDWSHDQDVEYRMPDKEQWLALRAQGGSRNWPKLPNCFPT